MQGERLTAADTMQLRELHGQVRTWLEAHLSQRHAVEWLRFQDQLRGRYTTHIYTSDFAVCQVCEAIGDMLAAIEKAVESGAVVATEPSSEEDA